MSDEKIIRKAFVTWKPKKITKGQKYNIQINEVLGISFSPFLKVLVESPAIIQKIIGNEEFKIEEVE